jgi:hypothetical protein
MTSDLDALRRLRYRISDAADRLRRLVEDIDHCAQSVALSATDSDIWDGWGDMPPLVSMAVDDMAAHLWYQHRPAGDEVTMPSEEIISRAFETALRDHIRLARINGPWN